jgi:hypothetical protein
VTRLLKEIDDRCEDWSTGSAAFYIEPEDCGHKIVVGVHCRIADFEETEIALLDTGAQWSVVGGELAHEFDNYPILRECDIDTRFGRIKGKLLLSKITLIADEGNDLSMEGTIFVSEDWPGPIVLGFRGFMEKLRIALDPGIKPGREFIYFGQAK